MQAFLKWFFVVLVLQVSVAGYAYADDSDDIKDILTAEEVAGDDFHKILKGMWGDFIFGGSGEATLLSTVVGYTNVLALILGIIIVSYVSVASVINSAQTGEVLGKQWNSYWLPIRTATAFGLLVPSQAGGMALSTAQVIVIKLVIMASTSATFVWNKTVDTALELTTNKPSYVQPYKLAYDTTVSLACTETVSDGYSLTTANAVTVRYSDGGTQTISTSDVKTSFASGISTALAGVAVDRYIEKISFMDGSCGTINFMLPNFDNFTQFSSNVSSGQKQLVSTYVNIAETQAKQRLYDFQTAYIDFINSFLTDFIKSERSYSSSADRQRQRMANQLAATSGYAATSTGVIRIATGTVSIEKFSFKSVAQEYVAMMEDEEEELNIYNIATKGISGSDYSTHLKVAERTVQYRRLVDAFIQNVEDKWVSTSTDGSPDLADMRTELKKGGWVYAGSFFYKIAKLEGLASKAAAAMNATGNTFNLANCKECREEALVSSSIELISFMYKNAYRTNYLNGTDSERSYGFPDAGVNAQVVPMVSTQSVNTDLNSKVVDEAISKQTIEILAAAGSKTSEFWSGAESGSSLGLDADNPFQFAADIGHGMNDIRYLLWMVKFGANVALYTTDSLENGVNSSAAGFFGAGAIGAAVFGSVKASLASLVELLTIALTLITAMAWTLAYYIPMMPALLWITLIGAYLLIVIEAVVATPLAVILMATPEGEGISGTRFQNAIILLASVYLRPALMVVGLVAAIYVAKYSFMVLNVIFWSQAESAVVDDIFAFFAIFALYITSLHQVLSNSIKSIDSLPTAILNWVGQGVNAQFGQNEISGASQQLDAKENAFGSAGDNFKTVFENFKKKKEDRARTDNT